jgi:tetratricopeptide (TPR) repeat protein
MRRPDADASRAAARIAATSDRSITREGYAGSSHLASVPLILRAALAAALPLVLAASPSPAQVIEETQGRIDTLRLQARRDSCDATVFYALGIALFSRHRYDAADTAFAQAVAIDPRIAQGYLALGLVQDENRSYWNRLRREGQEAYDTERRRRIAFARKAFLLDPFVDIRLLIATPYIEAWPYLETQLKVTTIRFPLDSVAPRPSPTPKRCCA